MAETMGQLVTSAQMSLTEAAKALTARRWGDAEREARKLLSDVSKLHQRLRVLQDVGEEAGVAAAEVDRALKRAEAWQQSTIAVQLEEAAQREAKARKPSGRKGAGR